MVSYINDRVGIQRLEDRKPTVWNAVVENCLNKGLQNIEQVLRRSGSDHYSYNYL